MGTRLYRSPLRGGERERGSEQNLGLVLVEPAFQLQLSSSIAGPREVQRQQLRQCVLLGNIGGPAVGRGPASRDGRRRYPSPSPHGNRR
jgi:hypothetical protein